VHIEAASPQNAAYHSSKLARIISLENVYNIGIEKQKFLGALSGVSTELEEASKGAIKLFEDIPNYAPSIDNLTTFTHNLINRFEVYVQKKKCGRNLKLMSYKD